MCISLVYIAECINIINLLHYTVHKDFHRYVLRVISYIMTIVSEKPAASVFRAQDVLCNGSVKQLPTASVAILWQIRHSGSDSYNELCMAQNTRTDNEYNARYRKTDRLRYLT
jgi:hypothetical protein